MLTIGGLPAYARCGFWTLLAYIVRKAGYIEASNAFRRRAQWNKLCGDWWDAGFPCPERYTDLMQWIDCIVLYGIIGAVIGIAIFFRT